jgi:hypothetical protein
MLSMLLSSHLVYIAVVRAETYTHADESFVMHIMEGGIGSVRGARYGKNGTEEGRREAVA